MDAGPQFISINWDFSKSISQNFSLLKLAILEFNSFLFLRAMHGTHDSDLVLGPLGGGDDGEHDPS